MCPPSIPLSSSGKSASAARAGVRRCEGHPHSSASHTGGWLGKRMMATGQAFPAAVDGRLPSVRVPAFPVYLCSWCSKDGWILLGQGHHQGPHHSLEESLKAAPSLSEVTLGCRVWSVGEDSSAWSPVQPPLHLPICLSSHVPLSFLPPF